MALWHFEFRIVCLDDAKLVDGHRRGNLGVVAREKIESELNEYFVKSASWSPKVVIYGKEESSNITLFEGDDSSTEILARVSMFENYIEILQRIHDIVYRNNLLVETDDSTVVSTSSQLIEAATASEAAKFCRDPKRFIDRTDQDKF